VAIAVSYFLLCKKAPYSAGLSCRHKGLPPQRPSPAENDSEGTGSASGGKPPTKRRTELLVAVSRILQKKPRRSGAKLLGRNLPPDHPSENQRQATTKRRATKLVSVLNIRHDRGGDASLTQPHHWRSARAWWGRARLLASRRPRWTGGWVPVSPKLTGLWGSIYPCLHGSLRLRSCRAQRGAAAPVRPTRCIGRASLAAEQPTGAGQHLVAAAPHGPRRWLPLMRRL
jgi:hypothetical protein